MSKILIDIGHPAHVHFYKYFIREMEKKGHETVVCAKEKEMATYLLEQNGIEYVYLGKNKKGALKKAIGFLEFDYKIIKISKKEKPDIFTGIGSPYLATTGKALKIPSLIFTDSEPVKIDRYLTYPFADRIYTPEFFRKDLGRRHFRYKGCHELAYLHPNYFKEDREVKKNLPKEFVLLRFVSWQASHDIGRHGISDKDKSEIIKRIEDSGKEALISSEGGLPKELERYSLGRMGNEIHTVLKAADVVVCDSQTMATESAILGTPVIRSNSFVGKDDMGIFLDLEESYGMIKNTKTPLEELRMALETKKLKKLQEDKRKRFLEEHIDVTEFMVNVFSKVLKK